MNKLAVIIYLVLFTFCTTERQKEVSKSVDSRHPTELIAFNFLVDSLLSQNGLLYVKDSFYLKLGLEEEMKELSDYSTIEINSCDTLISRSLYFSEGPNVADDSLREMKIGFQKDYEIQNRKDRHVTFPEEYEKDALGEDLSENELFVTIRNSIQAVGTKQVEIDVCKKMPTGYRQYNFYFFLKNETVIDWDFLEESTFSSLNECRICILE